MSQLVKYTEPKDLIHAVELAHIEKQWLSNYEDPILKSKLSPIIKNAGDAMRQTKNLSKEEISAILDGIIFKIRKDFKTLHLLEIETAINDWVFDGDEGVKIFSAANMVKAISIYSKTKRGKIIKDIWDRSKKIYDAKELTDEEKKEKLDTFYKTWKKLQETSGIELFGGYSIAYQLAKDLKLIDFNKSEFWTYIEQAKVTSIENLKNLQVSRAVSGVVYNNRVNEINAITFESVFTEKKKLPNEVVAECRQLAIVDYFRLRMIEE
jgi:hypothetical protein